MMRALIRMNTVTLTSSGRWPCALLLTLLRSKSILLMFEMGQNILVVRVHLRQLSLPSLELLKFFWAERPPFPLALRRHIGQLFQLRRCEFGCLKSLAILRSSLARPISGLCRASGYNIRRDNEGKILRQLAQLRGHLLGRLW